MKQYYEGPSLEDPIKKEFIPKNPSNADYIRVLKEIAADESEIVPRPEHLTDDLINGVMGRLNRKDVVFKTFRYAALDVTAFYNMLGSFDYLLNVQNTIDNKIDNVKLSITDATGKLRGLNLSDFSRLIESILERNHKNIIKAANLKVKLKNKTLTKKHITDWENA